MLAGFCRCEFRFEGELHRKSRYLSSLLLAAALAAPVAMMAAARRKTMGRKKIVLAEE
jgi:hypothetical protein